MAPCELTQEKEVQICAFSRKSYGYEDAFITATKWGLRCAGPEFYHAGLQALVPRWRKAVERDGDCVEK
jgi:hypothetical protein